MSGAFGRRYNIGYIMLSECVPGNMQTESLDKALLSEFESKVVARVPHLDETTGKVANPTPLVDMTEVVGEFAKEDSGLDLMAKGALVFGKLDGEIVGGSVKVRPAVRIIAEAISSGRLSREMTVFEATSGNFGLALAMLGRMGLRVVALVSRKLQPGVVAKLESEGVKLVNLDVDICPAPGLQGDADTLMARGVAASVREQLGDAGLDRTVFDEVRPDAEKLLARQDVIGLAKLLAGAYRGFCPEQYDNEHNVKAHEEVTGPEIDQQLSSMGFEPSEFDVVCAFGTGGSATGLSRHRSRAGGRRSVHVVYPQADQDVAGIRTKEKALGLKFYHPDEYASESEFDFERAKRLLAFLNERGYDVGESGALVLSGCVKLIEMGLGRRLVALIADGASKYSLNGEPAAAAPAEVTLREAASRSQSYAAVVWTHGAFVPREAGIRAIASSIGVDEKSVRVAKVREVQALMSGGEAAEVFSPMVSGGKLLLVCMVGGTSLAVAQALARKGIRAESLAGGITGMPAVRGRQPLEYIQLAAG